MRLLFPVASLHGSCDGCQSEPAGLLYFHRCLAITNPLTVGRVGRRERREAAGNPAWWRKFRSARRGALHSQPVALAFMAVSESMRRAGGTEDGTTRNGVT